MPQSESQSNKPLPLPEEEFNEFELETITLPAGTSFFRIHPEKLSPFYYFRDAPEYRFDAPDGDFGALYLSRQRVGAFAETISRQFFDQALTAPRIIYLSRYADKQLCNLVSKRSMTLVDLTSNVNALIMGVGAQLMSDDDYSWTQQWSRGLYYHPARFDGIFYQAKHAPATQSVAAFERFPEGQFEFQGSIPLTGEQLPEEILKYLDKAGFSVKA